MITKQELPTPPIDYLRDQYKKALRARRYDEEQVSSVDVDGIAIPTSREMRAALTAALLCGDASKSVKIADATWVTLTAEQMRTALAAIMARVQALFDDEQRLVAEADTLDAQAILIRM